MQGTGYVVALFRDRERARDAIEELRQTGVAGGDVGVVMQAPETEGTEVAATGAVAGGMLGGLAGWLVGAGALAIPGAGPLVAAGALATAAAGAAGGMGLGAITGALVADTNIAAERATWYEREVQAGSTLVSVHAGARADEVRGVLERHGAYTAEIDGVTVSEPSGAAPGEPNVAGG